MISSGAKRWRSHVPRVDHNAHLHLYIRADKGWAVKRARASLHDRRFMSQAGRRRYSHRLALRARVTLRAKYRDRPAWLILKAPVMQAKRVRANRCDAVDWDSA